MLIELDEMNMVTLRTIWVDKWEDPKVVFINETGGFIVFAISLNQLKREIFNHLSTPY